MDNKKIMIGVECTCPNCGKMNVVDVAWHDYRLWNSGRKSVQDAFPYLNDVEREMLITGICPKCQDSFFFPEEEEEDEYIEPTELEIIKHVLNVWGLHFREVELAKGGTMLKIEDLIYNKDGGFICSI